MKVRAKERRYDRAYKVYMSDALYAMGNLNTRYVDTILPRSEETRSADEIKQGIKDHLRQISEEGGE